MQQKSGAPIWRVVRGGSYQISHEHKNTREKAYVVTREALAHMNKYDREAGQTNNNKLALMGRCVTC